MDLDRFKQVETIYNSALEVKDSAERAELLAAACAGDDALRREVVSLLSSAECADSFMEEPMVNIGMAIVASAHEQLAGETIGRYKLLELLGRGGMGAVYLAHDARLNRRVALKLLPPDITDERGRAPLRRFEQEARAASAISHPNVAHIYEIGETDGRSYITMEHVRGRTLRQMMKEGRLKVPEALEIGIQVASALAAAHEAGVIHRDIKPENIMLRTDGYVKVLDFGLAKLVEKGAYSSDSEAETLLSLHTEPELLMGTSGYMSPEQVRRQPVDERTDLWSLGVVLYEMLVARRPFPGSEPSEVIVAILEREPEPIEGVLPPLPEELQRIVATALQKERDERYQTAAEMLTDLRALSRQLELAAVEQQDEERLSVSIGIRQNGVRAKNSASAKDEKTNRAAASPTVEQRVTTMERTKTAQASAVRPQPRKSAPRPRLRSALLAFGLIVGIVVPGLLIYRYLKQSATANLPQSLKFQPLPLPGQIRDAAISPDGRFVASVVEQGGKQTLHLMELSTSSDLAITEPSEKEYTGLSFSPDGNYIYYLENEAQTGTLYRVSKLGGDKRKLIENVNTPVTFSPDAAQLAFIRYDMAEQSSMLMTARAADGDREIRLVTRKDQGAFPKDMTGAGPAWDPQGNVIACLCRVIENGKPAVKVQAVSLRDGSAKDLTSKTWHSVGQLSWLPDGSGLILTGNETATALSQIWFLSYPGGEVSRVTNDASFYKRASLAKDSQTLLALTLEKRSDIWQVTPNRYEQSRLLTENMPKEENPTFLATGISWTPDGKIVYSARTVESQNIWLRGVDGAKDKQLTFEKSENYQPSVTPDGRYIVFVSSRTGGSIWRMNSDGSQPIQLTAGRSYAMPQVTPDSAWVVCRTSDGIWKVPIAGGKPILLMKKDSLYPVVSPDGRMLAFFTTSSRQGSAWTPEVYSLDDMSRVKRFDPPVSLDPFAGLRWTPDGRGLTYVSSADGASNLWQQPLDGSAPRELTNFKESEILSFGWSPDKNIIACVRGTENIRALLITGFPQ